VQIHLAFALCTEAGLRILPQIGQGSLDQDTKRTQGGKDMHNNASRLLLDGSNTHP
jgi:hypothetical protein